MAKASPDPTVEACEQMAATCACFNMRRSARLVTHYFDHALRDSGLRPTQLTILAALRIKGELAVNPLAEFLGLDQSSLSRNLATLESRGLVASTPGADRRRRILSLTSAGRAAFAQAYPVWQAAQAALQRKVGAERYQDLLTGVREISDAAAELEAQARAADAS